MTLSRAAFDKYEVIAPRNVYLGLDKVIKSIDMRSIIVKNIVRGKINRIPIKDAFHVSKLQANMFLVKELVSNNLKMQFNLNKRFVKLVIVKPLQLRYGKKICMKLILRRCIERMWPTWCNFQREMVRSSFGTTALAIFL